MKNATKNGTKRVTKTVTKTALNKRSPRRLTIGNRNIGPGLPCYVIAELSANHQHRYETAEQLVHEAHKAGVHAVKLQTYTADTITIDAEQEHFKVGGGTLWDGRTLHNLYEEAHMPWEWQPKLKALAESLGMDCFSSPFDDTAVDFLEEMQVPAYKIASFELVDLPLIRRCAQTGKPLIMSTGMATLGEIEEAVLTAREAGAGELALLVCSSAYPSPPEAIRLQRLSLFAELFDVVVGLSDHTMGTSIPIAAVAMGASLVEKHFCLSRDEPGPDSSFSLEPAELTEMVQAIAFAERSIMAPAAIAHDAETSSKAFRRSLFVVKDIAKGAVFTSENVRSIRPAGGLHTRYLESVLGQTARRELVRGTPLKWGHVSEVDPN